MRTYAQTDVMWLCGYNMYLRLPTDWKGLCALVHAADHSYVISAHLLGDRWNKRSSNLQDAIWGTGVSPDHKLWMQNGDIECWGIVNSTTTIMEAERVELRWTSFTNLEIDVFFILIISIYLCSRGYGWWRSSPNHNETTMETILMCNTGYLSVTKRRVVIFDVRICHSSMINRGEMLD